MFRRGLNRRERALVRKATFATELSRETPLTFHEAMELQPPSRLDILSLRMQSVAARARNSVREYATEILDSFETGQTELQPYLGMRAVSSMAFIWSSSAFLVGSALNSHIQQMMQQNGIANVAETSLESHCINVQYLGSPVNRTDSFNDIGNYRCSKS